MQTLAMGDSELPISAMERQARKKVAFLVGNR